MGTPVKQIVAQSPDKQKNKNHGNLPHPTLRLINLGPEKVPQNDTRRGPLNPA